MTPDGLAETHKRAFGGKGWPSADFATYLNDPNILIYGDNTCFTVLQLAGPEAEVLTLATHPDVQSKGHATAMMRGALDTLEQRKVEDVFLEVADNNQAARALYARFGFVQFAIRRAYYADGADAICMKAVLSPRLPA